MNFIHASNLKVALEVLTLKSSNYIVSFEFLLASMQVSAVLIH